MGDLETRSYTNENTNGVIIGATFMFFFFRCYQMCFEISQNIRSDHEYLKFLGDNKDDVATLFGWAGLISLVPVIYGFLLIVRHFPGIIREYYFSSPTN